MSSTDKTKLDGIEAGANNYTYTLPTATATTLGGVTIGDNITTTGSKISITKGNVTKALGYTPSATDTKYDVATPSKSGLMSSTDKTKLDGIEAGANNYTYTLPTATATTLGGVTIGDNITTTGSKISITKGNVTKALGYTPSATDTKYDVATPSKSGLMSSTDKTKLDSLIYAYPVGSVYISISSNFNPNTSFGGTWERFGQGRTLIGEGTGSDGSTSMTFTADATGGTYAETLTTYQIPSHNHIVPLMRTSNEASGFGLTKASPFINRVIVSGDDNNDLRRTQSTYTGRGSPHNNVQPYITVYFWKRTA
jgi:hypothetical protein